MRSREAVPVSAVVSPKSCTKVVASFPLDFTSKLNQRRITSCYYTLNASRRQLFLKIAFRGGIYRREKYRISTSARINRGPGLLLRSAARMNAHGKSATFKKSPAVIYHPRMIASCRESYSFQCVHSWSWLKPPPPPPDVIPLLFPRDLCPCRTSDTPYSVLRFLWIFVSRTFYNLWHYRWKNRRNTCISGICVVLCFCSWVHFLWSSRRMLRIIESTSYFNARVFSFYPHQTMSACLMIKNGETNVV